VSELAGRVVIVTGAARGLGRDYARNFARDGANVVVADVKGAEGAAADASAAGARAIAVDTDVTDRASVEALMKRTKDEFGRLDILVNNAGLWRGLAQAGLLECPDDLWDAAWRVNVDGTLKCCQAAVRLMKERGWGRIINVSSVASAQGGNAYGLTKAAVEHMTAGLAREVGRFGVTVNCLAPGISAFEGAKGQIPNFEKIIADSAIQRVGTTRDLYGAVRYLCSDEAEWVTGQTLRVDGGASVR
jgi:3-oxoacyl-[acyl-carrier protein] reductase